MSLQPPPPRGFLPSLNHHLRLNENKHHPTCRLWKSNLGQEVDLQFRQYLDYCCWHFLSLHFEAFLRFPEQSRERSRRLHQILNIEDEMNSHVPLCFFHFVAPYFATISQSIWLALLVGVSILQSQHLVSNSYVALYYGHPQPVVCAAARFCLHPKSDLDAILSTWLSVLHCSGLAKSQVATHSVHFERGSPSLVLLHGSRSNTSRSERSRLMPTKLHPHIGPSKRVYMVPTPV
mmetsp:Transcript_666/g.1178  ORF Transcript_666/g.1178 Transcript_666/m.1178 type:complete len:234 (+) Transcript_666:1637-2338(+)